MIHVFLSRCTLFVLSLIAAGDAIAAQEARRVEVVKIEFLQALSLLNSVGQRIGWSAGLVPARATLIFQDGELRFSARTGASAAPDDDEVLAAIERSAKDLMSKTAEVAEVLAPFGIDLQGSKYVIVDMALSPTGCPSRCAEYKAVMDRVAQRLSNSLLVRIELGNLPTPISEAK